MLFLEQLEERCVPSGLIPSPTSLTQVYDNSPNFDSLGQVMATQYAPLLSSWGVGPMTYKGGLAINSPVYNNGQTQQLITNLIAQGLVDPKSLIIIYMPNSYIPGAGGYHSTFNLNGQPIVYGVVWSSDTPNFPQWAWDYEASHELAEAEADPSTTGTEICDPSSVVWKTIHVAQFHLADFILPSGQPYAVGEPPQDPDPPPPLVHPTPPSAPTVINTFNDLIRLFNDAVNYRLHPSTQTLDQVFADVDTLAHDPFGITALESLAG